jgi:hypothetical protein
MPSPFESTRADGRSDRRVIYDLVGDNPPETLFDYDTLTAALAVGVDATIDRRRIYRAVTNANRTLLREKRLYLAVVANVGYRILRADEHLPVAIDRKHSAVAKLRQGMDLLRHARIEELPEAQRVLHEGQLMIMSGLYDAMRESGQRHDRQEQVIEALRQRQREDIDELRKRLDRIESNM